MVRCTTIATVDVKSRCSDRIDSRYKAAAQANPEYPIQKHPFLDGKLQGNIRLERKIQRMIERLSAKAVSDSSSFACLAGIRVLARGVCSMWKFKHTSNKQADTLLSASQRLKEQLYVLEQTHIGYLHFHLPANRLIGITREACN